MINLVMSRANGQIPEAFRQNKINPLKTKHRLFYLKTQSVLRS